MLEQGFAPQVEAHPPRDAARPADLCFSATMPTEVETLVPPHLVRPVRVDAGVIAKPVAKVTQMLYKAATREEDAAPAPAPREELVRRSSSRAQASPIAWRAPWRSRPPGDAPARRSLHVTAPRGARRLRAGAIGADRTDIARCDMEHRRAGASPVAGCAHGARTRDRRGCLVRVKTSV